MKEPKEDGRWTGEWEYLPGGEPGSPAVAACGAIALYMAARDPTDFQEPRITATIAMLDHYHKRHTVADLLESPCLHSGAFYVSQALYHAGNPYWHPYSKKMIEVFAGFQRPKASSSIRRATASIRPPRRQLSCSPRGYLPLYLHERPKELTR